jgi:predicted ribosomally synthesized peptide with nif11-like leader
MTTDQLSSLLAKLKDDGVLRDKLLTTANFDDDLTLVQEAGFKVTKADLLRFQACQIQNLSDEQLERMKGCNLDIPPNTRNDNTCPIDTGCIC